MISYLDRNVRRSYRILGGILLAAQSSPLKARVLRRRCFRTRQRSAPPLS
jgi:hypothetical protein